MGFIYIGNGCLHPEAADNTGKKTIVKLLEMGVDGLITDKPLETREIITEFEEKKAKENV